MKTPKRPRNFLRYKNLCKESTVSRYEIRKDMITICFTDHTMYVYTNQSATPENIEKMKALATAGKGLGTFVKTTAKDLYLRKAR